MTFRKLVILPKIFIQGDGRIFVHFIKYLILRGMCGLNLGKIGAAATKCTKDLTFTYYYKCYVNFTCGQKRHYIELNGVGSENQIF